LNEFAGSNQFLQVRIEFRACVSVQAEFANQMLESSGVLGLAGDVLEDDRVGEHGEAVSLVVSRWPRTYAVIDQS
jgi:hypothetical protein